jgi:hypothetical protein
VPNSAPGVAGFCHVVGIPEVWLSQKTTRGMAKPRWRMPN